MACGNLSPVCMTQCCIRGSPFHRIVRLGVVVLVFLVVTAFVSREYNVLYYTRVPEYFGQAWTAPALNVTVADATVQPVAGLVAANSTVAEASRNETRLIHAEASYMAICVAGKDQNIDICEWLQYHEQVVGVGMFYIMDHGSSDPLINTIRGCFDVRHIGYHYFNRTATTAFKPQMWAYSECLRRYKHRHRWMAFIDLDEFLILQQKNVTHINQLLQKYEGYGALVVNWLVFGSSGHIERPQGGVMANYNKSIPVNHPQNVHIKSIVNTEWAIEPHKDPHHFRYIAGHFPVNSDFKKVLGPRAPYSKHNKISLYHYVLKSLEDYKRKASRGSAMGNFKKIQYFQIIDKEANVPNTAGQQAIKKMDPHKYDAQIAEQLKDFRPLTPQEIMESQQDKD